MIWTGTDTFCSVCRIVSVEQSALSTKTVQMRKKKRAEGVKGYMKGLKDSKQMINKINHSYSTVITVIAIGL